MRSDTQRGGPLGSGGMKEVMMVMTMEEGMTAMTINRILRRSRRRENG